MYVFVCLCTYCMYVFVCLCSYVIVCVCSVLRMYVCVFSVCVKCSSNTFIDPASVDITSACNLY